MISHGSKVKKFRVHLSKKDAYFLYFILESLEGLCFYSTEETPEDLKLKGMRAISINYLEENTQVLKSILSQVSQSTTNFSLMDLN